MKAIEALIEAARREADSLERTALYDSTEYGRTATETRAKRWRDLALAAHAAMAKLAEAVH